jgi:hypothetical protein
MTTVHAWFSMDTAIRIGSAVYRKPGGSTVNVTRVDSEKDGTGKHKHDEKYLGEVIRAEEGGCVRATSRVRSITG